ncbi:MAG TPA: phosphodiester glycosidase family protein [Tepidisphaeraceae bacterium]|jgi:exopolysaccharide biosynthesis protein|nr:phosphodiester glycosidase family protein [Tepidisphaeraceae bacterium]
MKLNYIVGLSFVLMGASSALAGISEHPYPAIMYEHTVEEKPAAQQIFVATIDLSKPGVMVRVSRGGADPDGDGPWQTTLMQPTKVAEREHFDVVINGDFFSHANGKDAEGAAAQKEFKANAMGAVDGPAETDGVVWAKSEKEARPFFYMDVNGKPGIGKGKEPPADARQVVAGSHVLVRAGKNVAPADESSKFAKGPHPRTAVGIGNGGKTLFLVVVDGRTKTSKGMSLRELAEEFVKLGAEEAINLDGGGSSVLAIRDPGTHKMVILNHPSDGKERSVGDVLGVKVGG